MTAVVSINYRGTTWEYWPKCKPCTWFGPVTLHEATAKINADLHNTQKHKDHP